MNTNSIFEAGRAKVRDVSCRWFLRTDFPDVYRMMIGEAGSPDRDLHQDLGDCFETPDTVGVVAERNGRVVGFLSYRLVRDLNEVVIRHLIVSRSHRRTRIGSALVHEAAAKARDMYHQLTAVVSETQLSAQLFLRACGFKASAVLHEHFGTSSAIVLERALPQGASV